MMTKYFMDLKEKESNFNLINEMRINRILFITSKKILKNFCFTKSTLPFSKIAVLIDVLDGSLSNWYSYLKFIIKKYPFRDNNKNDMKLLSGEESLKSFSSIEKDSSRSLIKDSSLPEFGKGDSGHSIFKLIKSPIDNHEKSKAKFRSKRNNWRNVIKRKIPEYYNYINSLNGKDFQGFNGKIFF